MPSLHSIIMVAIAAAGCSPIGKLVDAILAHLLALVTPKLITEHAKRLNRGRPRISIDAPKIKGCLADDPNVDRALLGFALNAHGIEANPDRWLRLMRAARSATSWYWFRAPSGKWRRVKCRTLSAFLLTHTPWHSEYLLAGLDPADPWWRLVALDLMREFRQRTGYRVVGIVCHRGEGCAHWHIVFSSVLRGHHRHDLGSTTGPGRRGTGCIGIAQVAALRRGYAGMEPQQRWLRARMRVAASAAERSAIPLDWALSQWLDARVLSDYPEAPEPTRGEDSDSENWHAAGLVDDRIRELLTRRRELRRLIRDKNKQKE